MQKNLSNELLAEEFIIKTVTRTENTNETRKPNAYLFKKLGVIGETNPKLVFGPNGEAITVWQTTYSIGKALHVPETLRDYDSMKDEVPETEAKAVSDVMESLREIYAGVTKAVRPTGYIKPE